MLATGKISTKPHANDPDVVGPKGTCELDGSTDVPLESVTVRIACDPVERIARRAVVESEDGEAELGQSRCKLDKRCVRVDVLAAKRQAQDNYPTRLQLGCVESPEQG